MNLKEYIDILMDKHLKRGNLGLAVENIRMRNYFEVSAV